MPISSHRVKLNISDPSSQYLCNTAGLGVDNFGSGDADLTERDA